MRRWRTHVTRLFISLEGACEAMTRRNRGPRPLVGSRRTLGSAGGMALSQGLDVS